MRFWFQVVGFAVLGVAGIQVMFHAGVVPAATFAESNLTNNEIRLEKLSRNRDAGLIILGSSLSGRLPVETFPESWKAVNLGLDGGNSNFGAARLLEWGVQPNVVVVEGNGIARDRSGNDPLLEERTRSLTFRWSAWMAPWRAERRPLSSLYSWLKTRKDARPGMRENGGEADENVRAAIMEAGPEDDALIEGRELPERLRALQGGGARVLIVMLPDGGGDRVEEYRAARAISAELKIPVLDVKGTMDEASFRYTDGLHLSLGSARSVVRMIEGEVERWMGNEK